jgi:hypothetical protein
MDQSRWVKQINHHFLWLYERDLEIFAAELSLHIWNSTDFCDDRSDEVYVFTPRLMKKLFMLKKSCSTDWVWRYWCEKWSVRFLGGKARPGAYTSLFIISYHISHVTLSDIKPHKYHQ